MRFPTGLLMASLLIVAISFGFPHPVSGAVACEAAPGGKCANGSVFVGTLNGKHLYTTPQDGPTEPDAEDYLEISGATWTYANNYCEALTSHGQSDWRLPTIEELRLMRTNRNAIGNFDLAAYWSNLNKLGNAQMDANAYQFIGGADLQYSMVEYHHFRCVRTQLDPSQPVSKPTFQPSTRPAMAR